MVLERRIMLALLGLFGLAVSAAFVLDADEDQTTESASDGPDSDEVMSVDDLIEPLDPDTDSTLPPPVGDESDAPAPPLNLDGTRDDDTLTGGAGMDDLRGHPGDDALHGEDGDDTLLGGTGNDRLEGGDGEDTLMGSWGDDSLDGGNDRDLLLGGRGDDVLMGRGDAAPDFLNGGGGDDHILAGDGDTVHGGSGDDLIGLATGQVVVIEDYDPAADTIEVVYEGEPPIIGAEVTTEGVTVLADAEPVARLNGIQAIDLSRIVLTAA